MPSLPKIITTAITSRLKKHKENIQKMKDGKEEEKEKACHFL
jgi:hypothetical protein